MNELRKKISRIVDELMIFQFNNGAENIQINVRKQKDGVEILFGSICHGRGDMEKQVERLNRYLKVDRDEAMEAYFRRRLGLRQCGASSHRPDGGPGRCPDGRGQAFHPAVPPVWAIEGA